MNLETYINLISNSNDIKEGQTSELKKIIREYLGEVNKHSVSVDQSVCVSKWTNIFHKEEKWLVLVDE